MSTSATDKEGRRALLVRAAVYAGVSVFCGVFAFVYSFFSHGVSSPYMTFLFAFPLLLGALPSIVVYLAKMKAPGRLSEGIYNAGVAAATVSSALRGVLEIAGTDSVYQQALMYAAAAMVVAGVMVYRL